MGRIIILLQLLLGVTGIILMMLRLDYAGMAVLSCIPVSLVIVLIINLIQKFKW